MKVLANLETLNILYEPAHVSNRSNSEKVVSTNLSYCPQRKWVFLNSITYIEKYVLSLFLCPSLYLSLSTMLTSSLQVLWGETLPFHSQPKSVVWVMPDFVILGFVYIGKHLGIWIYHTLGHMINPSLEAVLAQYTTPTGLSWSVAALLVLCNLCNLSGVCYTDHTDPILEEGVSETDAPLPSNEIMIINFYFCVHLRY